MKNIFQILPCQSSIIGFSSLEEALAWNKDHRTGCANKSNP